MDWDLPGRATYCLRGPCRVSFLVLAKRLLVAGFLGMWCAGCLVVPVHHAKKMKSLSTDPAPKQLDLTFIKLGETSRDEVTQRLSWIDTGVSGKNFFVGRWAENSWAVLWGAAAYYSANGGYNQVWNTHNVIIDFGDESVVTRVEQFKDKYIIANLAQRIRQAQEAKLDLSVPIKVPIRNSCFNDVNGYPGNFILSRDELEFLESPTDKNGKQKHSYKTPAENVTGITMGFDDPSQPQQICAVLHFRQKTRAGKKMSFRVDLVGTVSLVKYVTEYGDWQPADRPAGKTPINRVQQ